MPPKGKAKAGAKAKADAKAKAAPKKAAEPSKPAPTATPSEPSEPSELPATPAAGSGTAAMRQQREVAATPEPRTEPESHSVEPVDAQTVAAEPVDDTQLVVPSRSKESTVDLATIADPWAEVSDELAMARIKEEDWEVIEAENEAAAACQLNAKDTEMQKFQPKDDQRRWLVAADFSENQLTSVEALGGPMWLRHLNLGMNPMESLNGLSSAFPRLLVLDVSFIELPSVAGAWQALAELSKLRRLVAEGCSLCSFEDWEELPSLKTLEVNDNAIEELEELEILAKKCKGLLELDFRENEVAEKPGYAKKIAKFFPNLTWLDNQSRKKYVAKGADATYSADALKEKDVTAVDGMFKNESCSCLEGNPCLDRATCKDWANREKVAAEARKRKGLRDDSGKM